MQSFDPFDLFNQTLNFRQLEGFYELELADWAVNRKFRIVAMDNVSKVYVWDLNSRLVQEAIGGKLSCCCMVPFSNVI